MPNNLAIIGYPRIGKSSLAKQAVIQKKECLLQENKIAIWIDFSGFSSREAFFKGLVRYSFENLKRSGKSIDDEVEKQAAEVLGKQKVWDDLKYDIEIYFEVLRSKGYYTIFILDEFDEARNKFDNNPEAFREMRHLGYDSEQYGIAFVTTSRRSIRDIEIQSKVSSTLDGIFGKEYLTAYNLQEIFEYYRLYEDIGINLSENQKKQIKYYCGGHPYLLASLGFEIVETFKEKKDFDIDIIFRKILLHFFDYYEQLIALLREDKTFINLLKILFGPKIDINPPDIDELIIYGLIKKGEKYFIAFSEHFQNYLKYKEREENIEIDKWRLISQAEKGLRQLILNVFKDNFGDSWEEYYLNKYNNIPDKKKRLNEIFDMLKNAYQRDIEQYGSLALNLTLLDQTYIHQLFDYFILFSWDDLFKTIFKKDKSYWNEVKKYLEKVRNPMAHQKIEVLLESDIIKAEEYCKEILTIIENYRFA
ncbi:p-loop domain-containing protein [Desulfonema limicola]|uniref:P-loop domain-containing protein n=1 Tax=Desulfonema limicola TaxID=45656 RepID=A0A975GH50_9BACT|nr:Swt1 family HEPN domain-containing protein [Desulfonema limicola]QTA80878.1 p-loop domain-containing protein [Desulfonema limicola]